MLQLLLRVLSGCMLDDHNSELRVCGENCASLKKHTMPHLKISTNQMMIMMVMIARRAGEDSYDYYNTFDEFLMT